MTTETAPVVAEEGEIFAEGYRGEVRRAPQEPGYCYKVPKIQGSYGKNMITREKSTHDLLVSLGVCTIPEYEIEEFRYVNARGRLATGVRALMTDLTEGGRNLVFSLPDLIRLKQADMTHYRDLAAITRTRPVYNASEFFTQLREIINLTRQAGITVSTGFMLVASPEGRLSTVVGDYEDGVNLHATAWGIQQGWYSSVERYAMQVIELFPQMRDQGMHFIQKMLEEMKRSIAKN